MDIEERIYWQDMIKISLAVGMILIILTLYFSAASLMEGILKTYLDLILLLVIPLIIYLFCMAFDYTAGDDEGRSIPYTNITYRGAADTWFGGSIRVVFFILCFITAIYLLDPVAKTNLSPNDYFLFKENAELILVLTISSILVLSWLFKKFAVIPKRKKYMVQSWVWRIHSTPIKHPNKTVLSAFWDGVLLTVEKEPNKLGLVYNEVIENEIKKQTDGLSGAPLGRLILTLKTMRRLGTKVEKTERLDDKLEGIIASIRGDSSHKQILRDALANKCDGIITLNKKHFESSKLQKTGFQIIDLSEYTTWPDTGRLLSALKR